MADKVKEDKKPEPAKLKPVSTDLENGILVYETDAEDGTHFAVKIEQRTVKGTAQNGQVWFYAHEPIAADAAIRIK